jgi:hypothetical protein
MIDGKLESCCNGYADIVFDLMIYGLGSCGSGEFVVCAVSPKLYRSGLSRRRITVELARDTAIIDGKLRSYCNGYVICYLAPRSAGATSDESRTQRHCRISREILR